MTSTANSKQTEVNGDRTCPCKKTKMENKVTVVLGAQWGDEGKGKVVDLLAMNSDIVCRCQVCSPTYSCNLLVPNCLFFIKLYKIRLCR